jgi:hypothetical protein
MDTPNVFKQFQNVVAAQSTRQYPFRLPNHHFLAEDFNVSDEENERNKLFFLKSLGINEHQIAYAKQTHGNAVALVEEAKYLTDYDALISNKPNVILLISIADCTPVLIYDSENKAVAAIHAGWRGTVSQIVGNTLNEMNKQFGTIGKNCFAYIGTCISEKSFEVGEDVAKQFSEQFILKQEDKFFVNLKAANKFQLLNFGVPLKQIELSENCTYTNNQTYFSYRKENGKTGRMFALIGNK